MAKKLSKSKRVAPAPGSASAKQASQSSAASGSSENQTFHEKHAHLFVKESKPRGIGHVGRKRDLSRYVRWPRYIRLQRQRAILKKRLKVPPSINHFTKTLEKNQATQLFRLLSQYRPETAEAKKQRLQKLAGAEVADKASGKSAKPKVIKFGLNHVTTLVEQRKAKLVVIAHDVDPIELVLWLPALCRKMDVPYVIVKGKARLGKLVHQKTATALALTEVSKEHENALNQIVENTSSLYDWDIGCRQWGQSVLGFKAQAVVRKAKERADREAAALLAGAKKR